MSPRLRTWLWPVLGVVAAVAVVVALGGAPVTASGSLDPENPGPGGARAVSRVLEQHGVDVTVARDADALEAAAPGAGTTVLVTSTDQLGRSTVARLVAATGSSMLVLAAPGPGTTEALGQGGLPATVLEDGPRPAGCADPRYAGLTLEVDHVLEYPGPTGCFRGEQGAALAQPRDGLVLLGAAEALRNDQVLRADDAAVALRLLGERPHLVWYVPTAADLVGDDGVSLATLLPHWLGPGLWIGALALLAVLLWRGRRLGPLATEPLPVQVKAVETTLSRGRLYRRAGDRAHAAAALRAAARRRARSRLDLPAVADDAVVVRTLAEAVGRPVAELDGLLGPDAPAPGTDPELIALAGTLAELDREVRTR